MHTEHTVNTVNVHIANVSEIRNVSILLSSVRQNEEKKFVLKENFFSFF